MSQVSLYRKYRSQTFSDLIGQNHVVKTLQSGINTGRIAHSYLFTGPRGTGKTSSARLLAKALCCENGPTAEPDNTCDICQSITNGSCVDVIEMDAASQSGVDDIREKIVEIVEYRPMVCRYKIFIIDEVHDLSPKAFDALLKTIEEPPAHIIFILATTEYNKVPPTIRSRCQKFEFHRAGMQDLVNRLTYVATEEKVSIEPAAITAIARMADGGYRDALTLLEQAMLTTDGTVTLDHVYDQLGMVADDAVDGLLLAIKDRDVPTIMDGLAALAQRGRDPRTILESMMYRMSDLTRASFQIQVGAPDAISEASLHEIATRIGRDTLLKIRSELSEAHRVIRDISLPRLWLEAELVRIATQSTAKQVAAPEPVAKKPEPAPVVVAPTPTPTSAPTPQPETKAPVPVAASKSFWDIASTELNKLSKTLAMKLVGSQASDNGSVVTVEFSKETYYDWVREKPNVVAAVKEAVNKALGTTDRQVEFSLRKEDKVASDHVAVELPAEGDALVEITKRIFNQ